MDNAFDPYRKWLGIRAAERPLSHYQLVGLEPFDDDTESISHAADQRIAYVRTLALGTYADVCQRILNELTAARVCLLTPEKKSAYDAQLRAQLAPVNEPPPVISAPHPQAPPRRATATPVSTQQAAPALPSLPAVHRFSLPVDLSPAPTSQGQIARRPSTRNRVPLKLIAGFALGFEVVVLAWFVFRDNHALPEGQAVVANVPGSKSPEPLPRRPEPPLNGEAVPSEASKSVNLGAPPMAVAPFSAEQARRHQQAWAAHLGVPVEYTNTLGMKFVLIPPGEFVMGSTAAEVERALNVADETEHRQGGIRSEAPQIRVILTRPIYLGANEVRQKDYEVVMGVNPSWFSAMGRGKEKVANLDTRNHPVETVSWSDAAEFCSKLSDKEKLRPFYSLTGGSVSLLEGTGYRLPTEAEWEFACTAGTTTQFWTGDRKEQLVQAAWFGMNTEGHTQAVGKLDANPFGLYDIHGNVWEWVQDWWQPTYFSLFQYKPAIDPRGPSSSGSRGLRGGDWGCDASQCRSSFRNSNGPTSHFYGLGFRVVLEVEAVKAAITEEEAKPASTPTVKYDWPADSPPPARSPFSTGQARAYQDAWAKHLGVPVEFTNTIGMKFVLIPPGEFMMGSTSDEITAELDIAGKDDPWKEHIRSEVPQHKVILTQPIYLGVHEVTQAQFEQVAGQNPSHFAPMGAGRGVVVAMDTTRHPVERVSWYDAAEFCVTLSKKEQLKPFYVRSGETVTILEGTGYRLVTEAEWEFACQAGSTTRFWFGDQDQDLVQAGWFGPNSGGRTHAVGELKANPFGLFDVHGNVWEWVQDWWAPNYYVQFQTKSAHNPSGPFSAASERVMRGAGWEHVASHCRASYRNSLDPSWDHPCLGFRVALSVDAVKAATRND